MVIMMELNLCFYDRMTIIITYSQANQDLRNYKDVNDPTVQKERMKKLQGDGWSKQIGSQENQACRSHMNINILYKLISVDLSHGRFTLIAMQKKRN